MKAAIKFIITLKLALGLLLPVVKCEEPGFFGLETETHDDLTNEDLLYNNWMMDRYKIAIQDILSASDAKDYYSLDGHCLAFSSALLEELQSRGFLTIQLAETHQGGQSVEMRLENGTKELANKTHYFLVDRSLGENHEIIIDPTIYQFLSDKSTAESEGQIFVGDQNELNDFYQRHQAIASWNTVENSNGTHGMYQPEQLVCLLYSVDQCSSNRKNY